MAQQASVAQMGTQTGRCEAQSPCEVPTIPRQPVLSSCHIHLPEQWNKANFIATNFTKQN